MNRGITREQVIEACEKLVSEGIEPSIKIVRKELGDTGSEATIHKHLSAWRKDRQGDLTSDLQKKEAEARLKETELKAIRDKEFAQMQTDNAELETSLEEKMQELEDKNLEIMELKKTMEGLKENNNRQKIELEALRTAMTFAEQYTKEFTQFREMLLAEFSAHTEQADQIAELKAQVNKFQHDLATERERYTKKSEETEKYKVLVELAKISNVPSDDPRLTGEGEDDPDLAVAAATDKTEPSAGLDEPGTKERQKPDTSPSTEASSPDESAQASGKLRGRPPKKTAEKKELIKREKSPKKRG